MAANIEHILASSEVRSCHSKQEKVIVLSHSFGFSVRKIAAALNMSSSSVGRILMGYKNGRPVGNPGRPPLLSDQEERELVAFIKSHEGISRAEVKEEVG